MFSKGYFKKALVSTLSALSLIAGTTACQIPSGRGSGTSSSSNVSILTSSEQSSSSSVQSSFISSSQTISSETSSFSSSQTISSETSSLSHSQTSSSQSQILSSSQSSQETSLKESSSIVSNTTSQSVLESSQPNSDTSIESSENTESSSSISTSQSSSSSSSEIVWQQPEFSNIVTSCELDLSINSTFIPTFTVSPSDVEIQVLVQGATVNDGQVTFNSVGDYTVTVMAINGDKTASFDIVVHVYNKIKLDGDGSQTNPFKVETAQDLELLSSTVYYDEIMFENDYFVQTGDIDLQEQEWLPIGTIGIPFKGHYDGANYTVRGLKIDTSESYQGLFGFVMGGSVNNLTVRGSVTSILEGFPFAHSFVAGIAGAINNGAEINNCVNYVNVKGDSYVGGIVGEIMENDYLDAGTKLSKIINCKNYGSITANASTAINEEAMYYGGIAGRSNGIIEGCQNYGIIDGDDEDSSNEVRYVGGIVGYVYQPYKSGAGPNETIDYNAISNCTNYGEVYGDYGIGGIVGTHILTVYKCENNGIVKGVNCVGGIAGIVGTTGTLVYEYTQIKECVNNAQVIATVRNLGGIAGFSYCDIINCTNTAEVGTSDTTIASASYYVGGIVGTKKSGLVKDCTNSAKVIATAQTSSVVGGIVGENHLGNIENCINDGEVCGYINAGGIVGRVAVVEKAMTISGCENTQKGVISALYNLGGIAGRIETGNSTFITTITQCVNRAAITGAGNNTKYGCVGGIVGMHGSYNLINKCYNYGNITVTATTNSESAPENGGTGGISGAMYTDSQLIESENYGQVIGYDKVGGIVGIKNSGLVKNCLNNGEIKGSAQTLCMVGGIVGENLIGDIKYCTNSGLVSGCDRVGGIVGRVAKTSNKTDITIANCENTATGNVSGTNSVGGIVGRMEGMESTFIITITDCINHAKVSAVGDATSYGYVGGIVGMHGSYNLVTKSINYGKIEVVAGTGTTNGGTGGISGSFYNNSQIIDCVNEGEIFADKTVGGIIGIAGNTSSGASTKVSNCTNRGLITCTVKSAGGIAGESFVSVEKCNNYGIIGSGNGNYYAIGGIIGTKTAGSVSECNNYGEIKGRYYSTSNNISATAGIVGDSINGNIIDCTNQGIVSSEGKAIAGIVGRIKGQNTTVTISGCKNNISGSISGEHSVGGIVGRVESDTTYIVTIDKCENHASITEKTVGAGGYIGGIIGMHGGGHKVTQSINTGAVSGTGYLDGSNYAGIGGISGAMFTSSEADNCTNTGAVTGTIAVGGIVGYAKGGSTSTVFKISNCINNGIVTCNAVSDANGYTGGILGRGQYGKVSNNSVSTVVVNTNSAKGVAQIVGSVKGNVTEENNTDTSTVVS